MNALLRAQGRKLPGVAACLLVLREGGRNDREGDWERDRKVWPFFQMSAVWATINGCLCAGDTCQDCVCACKSQPSSKVRTYSMPWLPKMAHLCAYVKERENESVCVCVCDKQARLCLLAMYQPTHTHTFRALRQQTYKDLRLYVFLFLFDIHHCFLSLLVDTRLSAVLCKWLISRLHSSSSYTTDVCVFVCVCVHVNRKTFFLKYLAYIIFRLGNWWKVITYGITEN